jgi:hypothetical protein
MSKSYRERHLHRRVQIAKPGPGGKPQLDGSGNPVLAYDGLWFSVVSTGTDRVRLLPVDHAEFFRQRADEATTAQKARGKDVTVTADQVYGLYAKRFTRPSDTFAPAGHPEEFTLVLPKALAVNHTHGGHTGTRSGPSEVLVDDLSVFSDLLEGPVFLPTPTAPTGEEPAPTRKRKGKAVPAAVGAGNDQEEEFDVFA